MQCGATLRDRDGRFAVGLPACTLAFPISARQLQQDPNNKRLSQDATEQCGGDMLAKNASKVGPRYPQVVVLVGATGDLSRRKLLPGLFHLCSSGFIPGCRIIGVSLDDLDPDGFRLIAREALDQFSSRKVDEADWAAFSATLNYVPMSAGACALKVAVEAAELSLAGESRRLHYLSVPPGAALPAVRLLAEAGLVPNSRIVMEKPFGTDLASARSLNTRLHEVFAEEQIFRIDHFLGKEAAQNILAFRFANGLFEPIWNRNFIDHVQIDVPETLGRQTVRLL
jgi:glucose-6-phosphate 1-dehydrogenase